MRTRGQLGVTLVGNLALPAAGLLTAPLLARGLGPSGRGEMAAISSPALLAAALLAFGIPEALAYIVARREPQAYRRSLRWIIGIGAATAAVSVLSAAWSLAWLDSKYHLPIVLTAASLAPTIVTSLIRGVAVGSQQWVTVSIERGTQAAARTVGVLVIFLTDSMTLSSAITTSLLIPAFSGILYARSLRAIGDSSDTQTTTRTARFGLTLWLGSSTGLLLSRLDQTLLVSLTTARQLGYYVVAVTVAELSLFITNSLRDIVFSKAARNSNHALTLMLAQFATLTCILLAALLSIAAHLFLEPIFGREFEPALSPMLLMLFATAIGAAGSVAGSALNAANRIGLRNMALGFGLATNIGLLYLLAPPFGAVGAAAATAVANILCALLNVVLFARHANLSACAFYDIRPAIHQAKYFTSRSRGNLNA